MPCRPRCSSPTCPTGRPLQTVADRLADPARPVDLLVNNAGYGSATRLPAQRRRGRGGGASTCCCRAVLVLSPRGRRGRCASAAAARIVNVSSVAGFIASGTYSAAKAWVTVLHRGAGQRARRLRRHGDGAVPRLHAHRVPRSAPASACRAPEFMWLDADAAGVRLPRRRRQGPGRVGAGPAVQGHRRTAARRAPLGGPPSRASRPPLNHGFAVDVTRRSSAGRIARLSRLRMTGVVSYVLLIQGNSGLIIAIRLMREDPVLP